MSAQAEPPTSSVRNRLFDHGPRVLALLTFLAGSIALISAAIPNAPSVNEKVLQRIIAEAPILALAFGGLSLMALSLGLTRRLKTAWFLTLVASLHGAVATLIFRPRPLELSIYLLLLAVLIATRHGFYRRSSLQSITFTRTWFLAAFLSVVVAGFFSLLWISHQKGFVEAKFIDLIIDPVLGEAGRPVALAFLVLALGAFYLAFASPFRPRPPVPSDDDFHQLAEIFEKSDGPRPDNLLAFSGDKSLFYSPDRTAAIPYAETAGVRIAMGPPLGPRSAWKEALEAFRKQADLDAMKPAIYSAPPELLPDLMDLSFNVEKIGENATLDLPAFSLSGRKREVIRRSRRKLAERSGATFRISLPPHSSDLLDRLKPVSDAWLSANGTREKSFSLGRFEKTFLDRCPIGIVEIEGRSAAFGSLLTTPDKSWAAIDLMRYDPDIAITNTMDFLLVELILWAKEDGYQKFDLAMAPLSGLVEAEFAPLYAKVGHFIFERGERFYNFRGLRRFKQKFDPDWEPRYIAAPGYWSLPIVLAHAARLTNNTPQKKPQALSVTRAE
ncbi:MAG: phosphatidylglycerol lysyltransferase domain-containing protein [Pseudomonadota bacterium]